MTEETQVISWNVNDTAIAEVADQFKDVDAYEDLGEAKAAKKTLTKMRTRLSEAHKETKAEALAFGRKVDAEKNRLLELIREIEDPISEQLTDIRLADERKEAERTQAIMDSIEEIQAFALDRHSLTLDELEERRSTLGVFEITEEVFQEHLDSAQLSKDEADMKLRLAIDAEKTRLKEEEEKERIEAENKELREKLAKQQAEQDEKERIAREEADAQAAKDREAAAVAEAEVRRLQDLQDERDREEASKAQAEEDERRRKEQAPDREQLLDFAVRLDDLLKSKPTLTTDVGNEILLNAAAMLIEVAYDIRKSTEEMK